MRLLLSAGQNLNDARGWLARDAVSTQTLAPGIDVSFCRSDRLVKSADGRWSVIIGSGKAPPDPASRDQHLAATTPAALFDHLARRLTLLSHPLGRGTFFLTSGGRSTFVSDRLVNVAERLPDLRPNARMVADYFTGLRNRGVDLAETFLDGASQPPPGHEAVWNGSSLEQRPFWSPIDDEDNDSLDLPEAARRVRAALEEVIGPYASPTTACLVSGGLDSSAVAGVAHRLSGGRASLITYGNDLDSPRERRLRAAFARHLDTEIEHFRLGTVGFDLHALRTANRGADSPSGGLFSGIFSSLLAAARAEGFDTILTGEGGDEVFDPPPLLLADLLRRGRWGATLNALSFFASYSYETSPTQLLLDHGVAPLAARLRLPWPSPRPDPFLTSVLGDGFELTLRDSLVRARSEQTRATGQGWTLAMHYNYRQTLDLAVYEPSDLLEKDSPVRVISPLASVEVFRAANTLRSELQAGAWIGFRSKRLLATAAAGILPYEVANARKTGIGNLLSRLVGRTGAAPAAAFDVSALSDIGIQVADRWLDPNTYPPQRSLIWALLLNLCVWLQEMRRVVDEQRRSPA